MSGWIIRIDAARPDNWEIGKRNTTWGTKQNYGIRAGDDVFFWLTHGGGLVAYAVAAQDARPVASDAEVPWPDHADQRYRSLIPLTGITEFDPPLTTDWQQMLAWSGLSRASQSTAVAIKNPASAEALRRRVREQTPADIAASIRAEVDDELARLDSADDRRDFVQRAVAQRRGQPEFRRLLIGVYGGRCCITGCDAIPALEAAHIVPYRGRHTNRLANGLLLRADLHTLFDMHHLTVDAQSRTVRLATQLRGSHYRALHGVALRLPDSPGSLPDPRALADHNAEFVARDQLATYPQANHERRRGRRESL